MAGGIQLSVGYVATEENPADIPSRWGKRAGKSRSVEKSAKDSGKVRPSKEKVLTPGLHDRYATAANRLLKFWRECRSFPTTWDDMDVAVSQWLEHLFTEGFPKGYGSDGLAALQHFLPEVAWQAQTQLEALEVLAEDGTAGPGFAHQSSQGDGHGRSLRERWDFRVVLLLSSCVLM